MARVFIAGFETGDRGPWTTVAGAVTYPAAPSGMTGSYAAKIVGANTNYIEKTLPSSKTEIRLSFRWKFSISGAVSIIKFLDSAGSDVLSITRNTSTGYLEARIGDFDGTVLDTGAIALSLDTVYLIEVRVVPNNTTGVVQVKVDGSAVDVDYSGDTTAGLENIQRIRLAGAIAANDSYFDDLVVDDTDWVGASRIQAIYPTGAGTTTQWDPSSGSNYACVDERPANDFDYVGTNVADEVDTYVASDVSGIITEIKCVQIIARATKEGSPTPTQLQLAVRSGGTNYFSATKALPTSFGEDVFAIWETNPADSAAWEEADVNGVEIGVKSIT